MANEFKHLSVGGEITQAEYEAVGGHVLASQAIGDLIYATSTSQLSRLGIGSTGAVLTVTGGVPAWDTTWTPTGDLIPASDDTYDLGSASAAWQDLFLEGDISLTDAGSISTAAGALTIGSAAAINITPTAGSAILLDGTISIDAGVVTGATSITSTAFAGALTGNVTGNASGTAATVTSGTQAAITTLANVVEVGALNAGSITSGFTSIDVGSGAITTTGALSIGSMGSNWTNAGRTVADMGSVTTIDINGGTINGITDLAVADGGTGASTLNNLITMGTHTTGNYVATVTAGTGLTSDGATSGESVTHSLSVDASQGQITTVGALASGTIADGFGTINNGSNTITTTGLVSAGSLTVTGTTTLNGNLILGDAAADSLTIAATIQGATPLIFEGANASGDNDHETTFAITDPTADRTITFPDATLTVNAAANISGTTLASNVVTSSLTAVGTIATGVWGATDVAVAHGGTGASTAAAGFDALAPMTAEGDIIYGGSSGTGTRLGKGSDADVLTLASGVPTWATPTTGDITAVTAGVGLSGGGTVGALSIALDLSELSTVTPADGDFFSTLDSDGANEQKTTTTALATLFAGAGMTATSSVLNVIGGTGITANADEIVITPAQTTITSIYATDLIIGEDAQTAIDFGTADEIDFKINNAAELTLDASSLYPVTDVGLNLGSTAKRFQTLYGQQFHMDASVDGIGNNSYSGMSATLRVGDGAAVAAWDLVCISDVTNEVQVADADAVATSRVIGINPLNATIADNAEGVILFHGFVRNDAWGWTPGATLYLHTGGTGDTISATAPSGTDDCVVPIGVALEADMIYFNPSGTVIEHA